MEFKRYSKGKEQSFFSPYYGMEIQATYFTLTRKPNKRPTFTYVSLYLSTPYLHLIKLTIVTVFFVQLLFFPPYKFLFFSTTYIPLT